MLGAVGHAVGLAFGILVLGAWAALAVLTAVMTGVSVVSLFLATAPGRDARE